MIISFQIRIQANLIIKNPNPIFQYLLNFLNAFIETKKKKKKKKKKKVKSKRKNSL